MAQLAFSSTTSGGNDILVVTPDADLVAGIKPVKPNRRGPMTLQPEYWPQRAAGLSGPGSLRLPEYIWGSLIECYESLLWDPATAFPPTQHLGNTRPTDVIPEWDFDEGGGDVDFVETSLFLRDAYDLVSESRWVFDTSTGQYSMPPLGAFDAAAAPLLSDWFYGTPDKLVLARIGNNNVWRVGTSAAPTADPAEIPMVSVTAMHRLASWPEMRTGITAGPELRPQIFRGRWYCPQSMVEGSPLLDLSQDPPHRLIHPGLSTALYGLPPAIEYCGAIALSTADPMDGSVPPAPSVELSVSLVQTLVDGSQVVTEVASAAMVFDNPGGWGYSDYAWEQFYYIYVLTPTAGSAGTIDPQAVQFSYSVSANITGSYDNEAAEELRVWHKAPPWHPQLLLIGNQDIGVDPYPSLMVDRDG